ncbi:hypothetical protein BC833DRAFT_574927 [Globomyces pollinis-pini]|nr:hypothetical protein BC833DRAFT_574927 [Globomyces pollinis-pini]
MDEITTPIPISEIPFKSLADFSAKLYDTVCNLLKPIEYVSEILHSNYHQQLRISYTSTILPILITDFKSQFVHSLSYLTISTLDTEAIDELSQNISTIFHKLAEFRIEEIVGECFFDHLQLLLENHIRDQIGTEFMESTLNSFLEFVNSQLYPILELMQESKRISKWKTYLLFHVYRTSLIIFTEHIFPIICEYPESEPALSDLKICLKQCNETDDLIVSINNSLKRRLLIPDAKTRDIIGVYLSTKNCLDYLDVIDTKQALILNPIRDYLTTRKDALRTVVLQILQIGESEMGDTTENEDIKVLLSIFPAKSGFAKEYQVVLCEELMELQTFSLEEQVRHVEILKVLFGETEMSEAFVMLKDMEDSRRIHNHFRSRNNTDEISTIVLSNLFWPKLNTGEFDVPNRLLERRKLFVESFEEIQRYRKLEWMSNSGTVSIEVYRRNGESFKLNVSPLNASLLLQFESEDVVEYDHIRKILNCTVEQLNHSIRFWATHKILHLFGTQIVSLESVDLTVLNHIKGTGSISEVITNDDISIEMADSLVALIPVIRNILTNFGALKGSEIIGKISMFGFGTLAISDLDLLVQKGELEYDMDKYKLASK